MAEARLNAESIDYVNAHGSGAQQNDRHETAALKKSLGDHAYRTPVSSIKSMVGHSLGAIGSIEIAASVLAMEHHVDTPRRTCTPGPRMRSGLRAVDGA
ncbi:Beta-ACP synthase OS=Streptomyces microflavus OX=1919 GN=fabF_1 PE=3 SV=1 [Streptomyces microflavus]